MVTKCLASRAWGPCTPPGDPKGRLPGSQGVEHHTLTKTARR